MESGETTYGYRGSRWIKRIVVAADGSPASTRGLEQVADLAPRIGAKVLVVYVRHIPATAMMAPGNADASIVQALDEPGVRGQAGRPAIAGRHRRRAGDRGPLGKPRRGDRPVR